LAVITERLRKDGEDVADAPLPQRWVELIQRLDEHERRNSERSQSTGDAQAELVQAELAVAKQENVLHELMRIEEPTEEATALLEDLRQKVARAVAGRH